MDEREREQGASRKRTASASRRPVERSGTWGAPPPPHGAKRAFGHRPVLATAHMASDPGYDPAPRDASDALPVPATSPPRPRRKPYVVPDWAHTETAFLPRTGDLNRTTAIL